MRTFSIRAGADAHDPEPAVRDDAPLELRSVVVDVAYECGLSPNQLRKVVTKQLRLRKTDDHQGWAHVDSQNREMLDRCQWFEVFDVVEAIHAELSSLDRRWMSKSAHRFEVELNDYLQRRGFAWHLTSGRVEGSPTPGFTAAVSEARQVLDEPGHKAARKELDEAVRDLSRRPIPDLTGALHHSLAALECVARSSTGDSRATLGVIVSRHRGQLLPRPIAEAAEKLWGYSSETARHVREGTEPEGPEAALAVHAAAAVITYLKRKGHVE